MFKYSCMWEKRPTIITILRSKFKVWTIFLLVQETFYAWSVGRRYNGNDRAREYSHNYSRSDISLILTHKNLIWKWTCFTQDMNSWICLTPINILTTLHETINKFHTLKVRSFVWDVCIIQQLVFSEVISGEYSKKRSREQLF